MTDYTAVADESLIVVRDVLRDLLYTVRDRDTALVVRRELERVQAERVRRLEAGTYSVSQRPGR